MVIRLGKRHIALFQKEEIKEEVKTNDVIQGYGYDDLLKTELVVCKSIYNNVRMYYSIGCESSLFSQQELVDMVQDELNLSFQFEGKAYWLYDAVCEVMDVLEEHIDKLQGIIGKKLSEDYLPKKEEVKRVLRLYEKISEYIWLSLSEIKITKRRPTYEL